MLQAHIDESQEGDVFVMAGYVATSEAWTHFSYEWRKILDTPATSHFRKIDHFKMAEMRSASDLEKSGWFYRVIEDHVLAAVSSVIRISELRNALKGIPWGPDLLNVDKLENPYFFSFRAITDVLMQSQERMGLNEPIDFIFDEGVPKKPCIEGWDLLRKNWPERRTRLMGNSPSFKDDKIVLPLQAADLWAGWVRKWNVDGNAPQSVDKLPFPWKVHRPDLLRLHMQFSEEEILKNFVNIFSDQVNLLQYKRKWGWIGW